MEEAQNPIGSGSWLGLLAKVLTIATIGISVRRRELKQEVRRWPPRCARFLIAAAMAAALISPTAQAELLNFTFSFSGIPLPGYSPYGPSVQGTVTGEIDGLSDNNVDSGPTGIVLTSYPAQLGLPPAPLDVFSFLQNSSAGGFTGSFDVSGGQIIYGSFTSSVSFPTGGGGEFLDLNGQCACGDVLQFDSNILYDGIGNIIFTPAPQGPPTLLPSPLLTKAYNTYVHFIENAKEAADTYTLVGLALSTLAPTLPFLGPEFLPVVDWLETVEPILVAYGKVGKFLVVPPPLPSLPDPPVPSITSGGVVDPTLAGYLNNLDANEQALYNILVQINTDSTDIQGANTLSDLVTALNNFTADYTNFVSITNDQNVLLPQIELALSAVGVPTSAVTPADITNYVKNVENNGFSAYENSVFADLGLSAADIGALISDLPTDLNGGPNTIFTAISEISQLNDELTSVSEPSSIDMLLWPAFLIIVLHRTRKISLVRAGTLVDHMSA
jgi:hypothetical protein